ncbi:MAG: hypothetical protein NZ866_01715 [Patescibacteria group bacterium]|nr:hypothetical protein [Patescibacteria group bacterium]
MNYLNLITILFSSFFYLVPILTSAQSFSQDYYFCTDEYVNLIYFTSGEQKSLYLTSFSSDNKIHIANSSAGDNRSEGDNPILIQSTQQARTNLNTALRNHGAVNNFSKILTSYQYNTTTPFGFLKSKDNVRVIFRRITGDSILLNKILKFTDRSNYLYVSPRQILGRSYGCGRGVRLILERINTPPIIRSVNFEYDIPNRNLIINIEVDEPLNLLSFKIISQARRQAVFEYSSTTDNRQISFSIPVNLTNLPPNQRYNLELTVKDLDNAVTTKNIGFTTRSYVFNNPTLRDIIVKEISSSRAVIWVLTSRITDLIRDLNTRSIINYGTSSNLIQRNESVVNKICQLDNVRYDCAHHLLTSLSPNTQYNFFVTLINEADLITSSSVRSFNTLGPTAPIVSNLRVNLISSPNTSSYQIIQISGKVIENNLPINIQATLNNQSIPIRLKNLFFDVNLRNIDIQTTSELIINIQNSLGLQRILKFTLPALR